MLCLGGLHGRRPSAGPAPDHRAAPLPRGHRSSSPTRYYGQTLGVLDRLGIPYEAVGTHGGASRAGKARALASRSRRLAGIAWERRPDLALAHGSVDLAVVSAGFRIPSVQMQDYEFAGLQRQARLPGGAAGAGPGLDPGRAAGAGRGAPSASCSASPASRRSTTLPTSSPTPPWSAPWGSTPRTCWWSSALRRRPPSTTPRAISTGACSIASPAAEGTISVVIPRTGAQAEAVRSIGSPRLLVPEAGDRRPEPDRTAPTWWSAPAAR